MAIGTMTLQVLGVVLVTVTDAGQTAAPPEGLGSITGWEVVHRSGDPVVVVPGRTGTAVVVPDDGAAYVATTRRRESLHVRATSVGLRCAAGQSANVVVKLYGSPR